MKTVLALIFTLTGAPCTFEGYSPNMVTSGMVGDTVTIPCTYDYQYKYSKKHWCKLTLSDCVDLASTRGSVMMASDKRVSIRDERLEGVFYVTMTSLVMEDEGHYQCVMYRFPFIPEVGHNVYLNISMGNGSDSDAVDPMAVSFPSVAGAWAVIRWILFGLMVSCFSAVTWRYRRTHSEPAASVAAQPLQGSDSTRSHVKARRTLGAAPVQPR